MKYSLPISLVCLLLSSCSDSDINISGENHRGLSKTLVAIYSPTNGAILTKNEPFVLDYEVIHGIKSSYVKIQIDKLPPITVANIKARHHISGLESGIHSILVTEYRSNHLPSGSQALIKVTMQ
jgi:hypothetical protein